MLFGFGGGKKVLRPTELVKHIRDALTVLDTQVSNSKAVDKVATMVTFV